MKIWHIGLVLIIGLFVLASCGKSGDASRVVTTQNGQQVTCQQYCQNQKPSACAGSWEVSGESPNCKCNWKCSESTASTAAAGSSTDTAATGSSSAKLVSTDKQVFVSVGKNVFSEGTFQYVPSSAEVPGDALVVTGPGSDVDSVNVYKQKPRSKDFKLSNSRPVEMNGGEFTVEFPLWSSDSGSKVYVELVKKNGQKVSYFKEEPFTIVPKLS
jgi:hypothetical protein